MENCQKVWKSAETILPFSCCPLVFFEKSQWFFCGFLAHFLWFLQQNLLFALAIWKRNNYSAIAMFWDARLGVREGCCPCFQRTASPKSMVCSSPCRAFNTTHVGADLLHLKGVCDTLQTSLYTPENLCKLPCEVKITLQCKSKLRISTHVCFKGCCQGVFKNNLAK